jgi:hypothetical protein
MTSWMTARDVVVRWTVTICGDKVRILYQQVPVRHSVKANKENAGRETK